MQKLPTNLTRYGFDSDHPEPIRPKRVEQARRSIREWMQPKATMNRRRSSYGLKHDIERIEGAYLANGELIAAMILEGYDYEQDGLNAYFAASYARIRKRNRVRSPCRYKWLRRRRVVG